jgi:molybdenum cofactor biosynthesis protein B
MVDFQSRDTRRTLDSEDEDDETEPQEAEESEQAQSSLPIQEPVETPAPGETGVSTAYAVVTVTGDRSLSADRQGDAVVSLVEEAGGTIVTRDLVRPTYDGVQSTVTGLAGRRDVDVVVTVGGTGVEPDDITVDAIRPLFDKHLPGFGELVRLLAHETDGTAVVGTRTTAGIVEDVPVFAVPGTVEGSRHAVGEVVVPEAPHLAADASGSDR